MEVWNLLLLPVKVPILKENSGQSPGRQVSGADLCNAGTALS